jgi:hypothetical protein
MDTHQEVEKPLSCPVPLIAFGSQAETLAWVAQEAQEVLRKEATHGAIMERTLTADAHTFLTKCAALQWVAG